MSACCADDVRPAAQDQRVLFVGLAVSALVAYLGYRAGSLSRSGFWGAVAVGTPVVGFGGIPWTGVLGTFFISSSFLSHFRQGQKAGPAAEFEKGARRDVGQALANGGLGAGLAVLCAVRPFGRAFPAFIGAMAAVTADTWATEIGVLSRTPPRLITSGRTVPPGTSGGVTPLGTAAAAAGGATIGLAALVCGRIQSPGRPVGIPRGKPPAKAAASAAPFAPVARSRGPEIVAVAGTAGLVAALADSLLGATVQRVYFCEACGKETERARHSCGNRAQPWRGWPWLHNDAVNLIASAIGAILGGVLGA